MAEVTPTARGTAGFPGNGVYGGVLGVTANQLSSGTHFANKDGMKLSIFHFGNSDDGDTWTSEIKNAFACAWQAEDAADDCAAVRITAYTAAGSRGRGGAVFTWQSENDPCEGWLWVLHGS